MTLRDLCGVDLWHGRIGPLEVRIRGACRGEAGRIEDFYRSLSSETLYSRFMSIVKDPRPYIERVFDSQGIVIIAEAGGRVIGVAEAVPATGDTAEVGVVVHDEFQGMGVGRALTMALLKAARIAGIRRAKAYVMPGNYRALRLARKAGFTIENNYGDMLELGLDLSPING
ncbi:MAG: GNAT family N-acetyltransferase [Desulfurococcales archaeon]|nr:GNAT family N-acetyltransferase [Desulfurococcales archaeon]